MCLYVAISLSVFFLFILLILIQLLLYFIFCKQLQQEALMSREKKQDLPVSTRVGNPVPPSSLRCPQAR